MQGRKEKGHERMMRDGLYHKDLGNVPNVTYTGKLQYTEHAKRAAMTDRYGYITLPSTVNASAKVVEVEVKRGKPVKALFRSAYDRKHDLCLVVLLDTGTVKTVWLNRANDLHKTLDKSRYVNGGK